MMIEITKKFYSTEVCQVSFSFSKACFFISGKPVGFTWCILQFSYIFYKPDWNFDDSILLKRARTTNLANRRMQNKVPSTF